MSTYAMVQGFALCIDEPATLHHPAAQPPAFAQSGKDQDTLATLPGTRLLRIIRLYHGWRLWTATRDFRFGSYLELFDDGRVLNVTTRRDEGDDYYWARPADKR